MFGFDSIPAGLFHAVGGGKTVAEVIALAGTAVRNEGLSASVGTSSQDGSTVVVRIGAVILTCPADSAIGAIQAFDTMSDASDFFRSLTAPDDAPVTASVTVSAESDN